MPFYVYACPVHGEFEEFHSIKDLLSYCPECKKDNKDTEVKRLISLSSFVLAGSGWAKDNYR
jgi:putative FmdB family regulatory protein